MKANSQGLRKQVSLSATNDKSDHGCLHKSKHKPTQEHITTLKGMHALVSKKPPLHRHEFAVQQHINDRAEVQPGSLQ
jgi:hypothetical protein